MANPFRGAVELKAGEQTYRLSYSINALCELEDAAGEPIAKLANSLNDPENVRLTTVRNLIWAGLLDHHPEILDQKDQGLIFAGSVASEAGIPAAMEAVGKALSLAFPEQAEASEKPRPRRAANG